MVIVDRQELAEALKENRTLKRLNLAHINIGIRGVEAFAGDRAGEIDLVQFWYSLLIYSSCVGRRLCNDGGS